MWQLKQLEQLHEVEPEMVDTALNGFLSRERILREKLVIGAYLDGDINFGKAAELLETHPVALRKIFLAKGIPVRIGVESEEDILAEGVAAHGIREAAV